MYPDLLGTWNLLITHVIVLFYGTLRTLTIKKNTQTLPLVIHLLAAASLILDQSVSQSVSQSAN